MEPWPLQAQTDLGAAAVIRRVQRSVLCKLAPLLALYVGLTLLVAHGTRHVADESTLLGFAQAVLHGHYATVQTLNSAAYLWHGPALPLLLAPMVKLGLPLWAMRVLTGALLLFVAVALFERLLALRLGRREALVGAYALGLFLPFGYLLRSIAKEELALVLVVAGMYGITRAVNGGPRRYVALAGLALGALVYDRVEFGWVAIAMLIVTGGWAVTQRRRLAPRRFLGVCAIAVLSCIPWLIYTYSVTGKLFYWGNSGGLSLYWMSTGAPDQMGSWHAVHTVFHDAYLAPFRPFFTRVDRLAPLARDLALQHAALRNIGLHPLNFGVNLLANVSRMLFAAPLGVDLSAPIVVGYELCMAAVLAGAATGAARLRKLGRPLPREAVPLAMLLVLGFGIHIFPTADPRMLMPLIPVLVWTAAQGWGRRRVAATRGAPRLIRATRASPRAHAAAHVRRADSDELPVRLHTYLSGPRSLRPPASRDRARAIRDAIDDDASRAPGKQR